MTDVLRPVMRFDRPSEWPRLKRLIDASFGREDESRLVETLRGEGALSFLILAEIETPDGPGFIGAVAVSPFEIMGDRVVHAAAIAPIAVAEPYRGRGVGSGLVRAALAQCRRRGLDAACTLGATRFFGRLGFAASTAAEIDAPWSGPHFLALSLRDDLGPIIGEARYPRPFYELDGSLGDHGG